MIDLLMLGIVPGTNIQIGFGDWLRGLGIIVACVLLLILVQRKVFATIVVAYTINRAIRRTGPTDIHSANMLS